MIKFCKEPVRAFDLKFLGNSLKNFLNLNRIEEMKIKMKMELLEKKMLILLRMVENKFVHILVLKL